VNAASCVGEHRRRAGCGDPPLRFDGGSGGDVRMRVPRSMRNSHTASAHHRPTIPDQHPEHSRRTLNADRTRSPATSERHGKQVPAQVLLRMRPRDSSRPRDSPRGGLRRAATIPRLLPRPLGRFRELPRARSRREVHIPILTRWQSELSDGKRIDHLNEDEGRLRRRSSFHGQSPSVREHRLMPS
jgi:hypothetical protein